MSPMTIVVVRDEPAGSSEAGPSAFAAGFADSAVAGAGADVVGAPADAAYAAVVAGVAAVAVEAVEAVFAVASADGAAACCDKAEDETRRATRSAGIAERRFMTGETIGPTGTRQAAMERA